MEKYRIETTKAMWHSTFVEATIIWDDAFGVGLGVPPYTGMVWESASKGIDYCLAQYGDFGGMSKAEFADIERAIVSLKRYVSSMKGEI